MDTQNYTYDIALSFANEDLKIAKKIAKQLKRLGVTYYLYTEEVIFASNLTATTWNIYHQESRFAVVLISKHYKEKKWASREWDAINAVHRPYNSSYIIPIRLDDTELPGLHPDIIFIKWKNNASHTAISLFQSIKSISTKKVKNDKKKRKSKKPKKKQLQTGVNVKSKKINHSNIAGGDIKNN